MKLIPYSDILLVVKTKSFWGKVSKFFLSSKYSHCEYVVDNWLTFGTDLKNPASLHTFGYNLHDIEIWRYIGEVSDIQKDIITEFIQKATKTKYDFIEAVCLGLKIKYRGRDNKYVCISIILKAMAEAGLLPLDLYKKYNNFDVFSKSGYFYRADKI